MTGWLVAIHSANCDNRLLRCESGGVRLLSVMLEAYIVSSESLAAQR